MVKFREPTKTTQEIGDVGTRGKALPLGAD